MTILWWWCCTGSWHHLLGWVSHFVFNFDPQRPPDLFQFLLNFLFGLRVVVKRCNLSPFKFLGHSQCILEEFVHFFCFFSMWLLWRTFWLIWQFEAVLQIVVDRNPHIIGLPNWFWVLHHWTRRSYWRHWPFNTFFGFWASWPAILSGFKEKSRF